MTPDQILSELSKYPQSIFDVDIEIGHIAGHLAELKDSLEIAELNAELGAQLPDKSNEDTRKRIRAEAISKSQDVRSIKVQIIAEQARQAEADARRSMYLRQFQATMAMADLASAQLNMVACKTRKETKWTLTAL